MAVAKRKPPDPGPFSARTPLLEWLAAGFGLVVTLGAVGYLCWEGLQPPHDRPALIAQARAITPVAQGYSVDVRVRNESRATAAQVEVEGVLRLADGSEETADITFDYLPGESRQDGGLMFRNDPRARPLTLTVKGYVAP